MGWYFYLLIIYCVIVNIVAVVITKHDKKAARKGWRRVPERVLLIAAALSGCVVMYITMRAIHHKTRKKKFMIGIPVIFILECAAAAMIIILPGII